MHSIQERLLKLIDERKIGEMSLREIGDLIDVKLPQQVKHHLTQLEQKGFIAIDRLNHMVRRINHRKNHEFLLSIPILGSANCGPAALYSDQNIEGYLKVSKRFLGKGRGLFAVRVQGNSLNKANVNGKNIEPGDFVIIDSTQTNPSDGEYVLSIIDDMANIKKYKVDSENKRIVLISESTQQFNPIFIHEDDQFIINGKAIDVLKKFKEH